MGAKTETNWRDKAHRVIGNLCRAEWLRANQLPNGQLRKRHVPYCVPAEAQALSDCLRRNDEEGAKALFVHNYTVNKNL